MENSSSSSCLNGVLAFLVIVALRVIECPLHDF